jgi:hypothetical protein
LAIQRRSPGCATAGHSRTPVDARKEYLAALLGAGDKELLPVLKGLLNSSGCGARRSAGSPNTTIRRRRRFIVPAIPAGTRRKRDALGTLTSRVACAKAPLEAVEKKKIPVADLAADLVARCAISEERGGR